MDHGAHDIRHWENVLQADPDNSDVIGELARLRLANGELAAAIEAYGKCMTLAPHSAAVRNNLGAALIRATRFAEAVDVLQGALTIQPGYPRALVNLGKALTELGRHREARSTLEHALAVAPDYVPALINWGEACAASGDSATAARALERAVMLAPNAPEAHMSLGILRLHAGRTAAALESLRHALRLAPDHAGAHSNLAHALFTSGDWQSAWPHFEHRFSSHSRRASLEIPPGMPRWNGTRFDGLEVWLLGEQGLGDQLQFARYAKIVSNLGVSCVLSCDPRLVRILEGAGLGARVVALGTAGDAPNARWMPLMSLPGWHRTGADSVPAAGGYLKADRERVARWRARLAPLRGLRVGLAWAGNPRMETGRHLGRSPPLAALAPLLQVPGVEFVSLQKAPGDAQLATAPFRGSIVSLPDLDEGPDAFMDTAAVLLGIDLLVTSDTAIAHLAGGLGVRCWLCLMHEPDWRWMRTGAATPWYASLRLFRQSAAGDWSGVYEEVARELAKLESAVFARPHAQR